jgi:ABC-type amino acid transport substrate-binding protein
MLAALLSEISPGKMPGGLQMFRKILLLLLLCSPPAVAGNNPDTLDDIRESGTIRIAHPENVPPFSFMENGEPTGYSINLCRQIVSHIAKQLGREDIRIRWRSASTPEALRLVADGVVDMDCGITSITLSRQQRVDFSNEIYVNTGDVLVQAGSDIKRLADLNGKKIAAIRGTTTDKRLTETLRQHDSDARLLPVMNIQDCLLALDTGKVDACAGDRTVLLGQVAAAKEPVRYTLLGAVYSIEPYALVLPRGDPDFRLAVNRALSDIYRKSTLQQLYGHWFGADAVPSLTLRMIYMLNSYPD